jgi:hypothetical protein
MSAGVEEPEKYRLRTIEQARRAAELLARGRDDGIALAPPEIQQRIIAWRSRLDEHDEDMDEEGWLIGMLTLACLTPRGAEAPR